MSVHQIAKYNYECPDVGEVRQALERIASSEEVTAAWARACERCDVPPERSEYAVGELARITDALRDEGGLIRVAAIAMAVRIRTYRYLQEGGR